MLIAAAVAAAAAAATVTAAGAAATISHRFHTFELKVTIAQVGH